MALAVIQSNFLLGLLNHRLCKQCGDMKRACPQGCKCVRLYSILQVAEIRIPAGQSNISHGKEDKIS